MKTALLIIALFLTTGVFAQDVWIKDADRKVIAKVDEKDLNRRVLELRETAKYVNRWIDGQDKECLIVWEKVILANKKSKI